MIENKINELFDTITSSKEYKSYLNIGEVLEKDEEISTLIHEIISLQQQSVELEYKGDLKYTEIDPMKTFLG